MPKRYKIIIKHVALIYNQAGNIKNYRYVGDVSKHIEDMEYYALDMEKRVHMEMKLRDQAKAVIETQTQELQALHTLTGHMEENIHNLPQQNMEKDNMIVALQAQLNPPPPPPPADDDSDDNNDDDEGDDDNVGIGDA